MGIVEELHAARDSLRDAEEVVKFWRASVHTLVTRARDEGLTCQVIGAAAGMSPERVTQIAPASRVAGTRAPAQKDGAEDSRAVDAPAVPVLLPAIGPGGSGVSGVVTQRRTQRLGRRTVFYDNGQARDDEGRSTWLGYPDADNLPGRIVSLVAREYADERTVRVFVAGPRPYGATHGSLMEAAREWALSTEQMPPGWHVVSSYLADSDLPIVRLAHDGTGQRITILRAAAWFGESEAVADDLAAAWRGLCKALDSIPAFKGAGLADTPATAGRALWLRTIPEGKSYPVMSDELRELIASTSGQGRIELVPPAAREVGEFTVVDGRFMYASLTWGMPVGEPTFWTGEQLDKASARTWENTMRGRGRWRVSGVVPPAWDHVGLLMVPEAGGGWHYPSRVGEPFETWADGSEVHFAMSHGWDVTVHEGFSWKEGKPLEKWTRELLGVWRAASAHPAGSPAHLAARAVRSLLLFSIGAFATRGHSETHSVGEHEADQVPAGVEVRRVGDRLVWQSPGALGQWSAAMAHPEWSATIWARARTRLLESRGVDNVKVGALRVPREHVVGFATDALYLAEDPHWSDDGAPGRFRVKGRLDRPARWPADRGELYALRDRAEGLR